MQRISPQQWLLCLIIFTSSLALRLLAIQVPINIDEDDWMRFSLHFIHGLLHLNLAETYQWHHPGVITMWINGSSQSLYCLSQTLLGSADSLPQPLDTCIQALLDQKELSLTALAIARVLQAVSTSAGMVYLFLLAQRLLGKAVALVGVGLLIVEPFFLAYQRLVVTDGLQTLLMTLATLSLLLYLRHDGNRPLLIGSGIWMGLAVATKTPTLTILPAIAIWLALIELGVWRSHFPPRGVRHQLKDMLVWGCLLIATFWVVFPAMWVNPLHTLARLVGDLQAETGRGYFFFMGALTDAPNALYYPVVLLYRLSPVLLLGSALGLVMLATPKVRRSLPHAPELIALLIASATIVFVFSNSANKIDRYILPTLPGLAFLAAVGWLGLGQWIGQAIGNMQRFSALSKRIKEMPAIAILSLVLVVQTAALIAHYPYYLTFFNPLLGGALRAQQQLMMGNGEGLDRAARWLNQKFPANTITVGSWYSPSFKPYSHHTVVEIGRQIEDESDRRWLYNSNYVVFYINQRQRQLPSPEVLAYFTAQPPLHTVQLHGVDYVQIYPGAIARSDDLATVQVPQDLVFGDRLRLRGYDVHQPPDHQPLLLTLYWEILKPPQPDLSVAVTVTGGDRLTQEPSGEQPKGQSASPLVQGFIPRRYMKPAMIIRDVHPIPMATDLPAGEYSITVALSSKTQLNSSTSAQSIGTLVIQ